jgi:hypothetical protein
MGYGHHVNTDHLLPGDHPSRSVVNQPPKSRRRPEAVPCPRSDAVVSGVTTKLDTGGFLQQQQQQLLALSCRLRRCCCCDAAAMWVQCNKVSNAWQIRMERVRHRYPVAYRRAAGLAEGAFHEPPQRMSPKESRRRRLPPDARTIAMIDQSGNNLPSSPSTARRRHRRLVARATEIPRNERRRQRQRRRASRSNPIGWPQTRRRQLT